ncbi:Hypothetical protein UVM_LOCUS306 [uncultured virus]|nr:Hypothetical protein UVM_LOCUS306 [uncultured virus]
MRVTNYHSEHTFCLSLQINQTDRHVIRVPPKTSGWWNQESQCGDSDHSLYLRRCTVVDENTDAILFDRDFVETSLRLFITDIPTVYTSFAEDTESSYRTPTDRHALQVARAVSDIPGFDGSAGIGVYLCYTDHLVSSRWMRYPQLVRAIVQLFEPKIDTNELLDRFKTCYHASPESDALNSNDVELMDIEIPTATGENTAQKRKTPDA